MAHIRDKILGLKNFFSINLTLEPYKRLYPYLKFFRESKPKAIQKSYYNYF